MVLRALLLVPLLMALGPCGGPEPVAGPGPIAPETFEAQKTLCERRGGRFGTMGPKSALNVCFMRTKDSNQRCTTSDDCEGVCLARSRTCAPVVPLLGCNEVVLSGGITAVDCVG